ncbi:MAG TPA: hypothetical protein VF206_00255 [Rubrobacter sp.]
MAEERQRKGSLLGVIAYVLVPGERRARAARHFRKAGFETLRGLGELVRPERPPDSSGPASRERIEIE